MQSRDYPLSVKYSPAHAPSFTQGTTTPDPSLSRRGQGWLWYKEQGAVVVTDRRGAAMAVPKRLPLSGRSYLTQVYNRTTEKEQRRELRNNMTPAEIILWSKLKGKGIGHKFRRQYSVGAFVLDFCCPTLKLAIEVDGDSHFSDEAKLRDEERQKIVESYGFTFLRFTNKEVVENVSGVVSKIMHHIEKTTPTPPY